MRKNISKEINDLIEISGLNQIKLAEKIGVTKQAISKYKNGKSGIDENSDSGKRLLELFKQYNINYPDTKTNSNFINSEKDIRKNIKLKSDIEILFDSDSLDLVRKNISHTSFDVFANENNIFKLYNAQLIVYEYSPFLGENIFGFYDKKLNKNIGKKMSLLLSSGKNVNIKIVSSTDLPTRFARKILFEEPIKEFEHIEFSMFVQKKGSIPIVFEYLNLLKINEDNGKEYNSYRLSLTSQINYKSIERKVTFPKNYPIKDINLTVSRNDIRLKDEEERVIKENGFIIEKDNNYINSVLLKVNNPLSGITYHINYTPPTISELFFSNFINKEQRDILEEKLKKYDYSLKLPSDLRSFESNFQLNKINNIFELNKNSFKNTAYENIYNDLVSLYNQTKNKLKDFITYSENEI